MSPAHYKNNLNTYTDDYALQRLHIFYLLTVLAAKQLTFKRRYRLRKTHVCTIRTNALANIYLPLSAHTG